MSSPGSGKTSTIISLNQYLHNQIKFGVMEADIDSDVDANKLIACGIPAIQLHTGGMCHLDVHMTRMGLDAFDQNLNLYFLENVGNLVCPAEYDTGAHINMGILSIPEGDDKVIKYPLMYQKIDVLVINKIDTISYFDFSYERLETNVKKLNPNLKIFYISSKTGEGVETLSQYLLSRIKEILE
jgi:hydrogenase nickel incorporation protein HypB